MEADCHSETPTMDFVTALAVIIKAKQRHVHKKWP